jgi:8-oxo-dGTP pyrophosphatase MutT (NUDIX family)
MVEMVLPVDAADSACYDDIRCPRLENRWLGSSPPNTGSFPTREDGLNLIEVHVAGVCIRAHAGGWQVLAARRVPTRSLFPGKWECGGGMVRAGEGFDAAIRRQMFEEFGLKIERVKIVEIYEIHIPRGQHVIPGIRFLCVANDGKVRLNRREFSSHRWIDLPIREQLDWIPGLGEVIDGLTEDLLRPSDRVRRRALSAFKPVEPVSRRAR